MPGYSPVGGTLDGGSRDGEKGSGCVVGRWVGFPEWGVGVGVLGFGRYGGMGMLVGGCLLSCCSDGMVIKTAAPHGLDVFWSLLPRHGWSPGGVRCLRHIFISLFK